MLPANNDLESERVLIHAPFGRDGTLIRGELDAAGFSTLVSQSVKELCEFIREGGGVALVGDEALGPDAIQRLAAQLANQPPWSNFPVLVMTSGGAATNASRYRLRLMEPLGNVTLLERPLRPVTLVSSVQAALRDRRHQYQLRGLLAELAASNEELKCANGDLTRVNRELEEFAYVSSHDLQEPLRMVNIYTHLILKATQEKTDGKPDDDDVKLAQYREFVRQGIDRMEALIRDLLTFSRTIQSYEPPVGVADLSVSLKEALSVLSDRIEESGAVITAGSLPRVRADAAQMVHVFQNLLSNSIKYRTKGVPPEIHISSEESDGNWIVSVTDNGIGFDQKYAERIFGLFKRLHKDEYPGTGLGLAICQRLVERYGGRIWATSTAGLGATFYMALPCVDRAAAEPATVADEEPARTDSLPLLYSRGSVKPIV
jgi:signal transduction histidine kinase